MSKFTKLEEKFLGMYEGKLSDEDANLIGYVSAASQRYDVEKDIVDYIENKLDTTKSSEDQIQDIVLYLETLIPPLEIVDDDFDD